MILGYTGKVRYRIVDVRVPEWAAHGMGMGKAGGDMTDWAAGRPDVTVDETHLTGTHERIPTPKGA